MILKKVKLRQITVVEALPLRVRQSAYALEKAFNIDDSFFIELIVISHLKGI